MLGKYPLPLRSRCLRTRRRHGRNNCKVVSELDHFIKVQVVKAFQQADRSYSIDKSNTIIRRSLRKLSSMRQQQQQIPSDAQSLQSSHKISISTDTV